MDLDEPMEQPELKLDNSEANQNVKIDLLLHSNDSSSNEDNNGHSTEILIKDTEKGKTTF